ncbi:uncharacterized protein LOC131149398 [Malania oleifera]|uniref:uncharacterized protein LOC131149398 n=1 Tax=Malania oleifera TaxID=397392 RepID=UPI0025ADEF8A|nr:uncharacterized protein LOC131149398 [Malania oleifera]
MRAGRARNIRSRSPPRVRIRERSPPRGEFRERYSSPRRELRERNSPPRREFRERNMRFVLGSSSVPVEPERSRRILSGERGGRLEERREYERQLDGDREGQLRKLSQFNEGLSQGESPSIKFQWKLLLPEPTNSNVNANPAMKPVNDYGVGSSRMSTERGYRGSGFSDMGPHGLLLEKPASMENDKAITSSAYRLDVGLAKRSTHIDSRYLLPLENNAMHLGKDEDLRFRDHHLHSDRPSARETYRVEEKPLHHRKGDDLWYRDHLYSDKPSAREMHKGEEKPLFYLRDTSQSMMPSSQSKTFALGSSGIAKDSFRGSYNDDVTLPSSGLRRSSGMPGDPVGCDGYSQTSFYKSSANSEMQPKDVVNYGRSELGLTEGNARDFIYSELRQSGRSDHGMQPDEYYCKTGSVRDDYASRNSLRTGVVDPIVDRIDVTESSHAEHLRESRSWEQYHSFEEHQIPSYLDVNGTSNANKQDGEVLASRSTYLNAGVEVYQDSENSHMREDFGFKRNAGPWLYEEKLKSSKMQEGDRCFYGIDSTSQQRLTTEELHMHDPSEKMLTRRSVKDKRLGKHKLIRKSLSSRKSSHKVHVSSDGNEHWTQADMGFLYSSKKSGRFQYKKAGKRFNEVANHRISASDDLLLSHNISISEHRHRIRPPKLAFRDIKKRLKPAQNFHTAHPSIRKYKPHKFLSRRVDSSHGSSHIDEGSPVEKDKVSLVKIEPPEGSDDFRQMVHNAFLKFVKQLNENPAQRRKYTEQQKAGSLKCSICGSNSEEFNDTQSLVMHAFVSSMAGFRAQHLGLHKALCLLMGWNSEVAPNSLWVCEALPDTEAFALKEDLIIWPPVVIIHNGSIENTDPAKRMVVTPEVLKDHIRETGFGGANAKVCRGKPANQSVMVVTFSGTFSGLQEAERLHRFYAESKHGRAEFRQIDPKSGNGCGGGTQEGAVEKVEHVLYGYLGLAGDLDKIDFETKKRCVVKSKKDIQAIADAPIRTE